MKYLKSEAIVLRRVNYADADRIITILTPQGRFGALAKGARRPQSKLAAGIEPLSKNHMTLLEGRGELLTLTSARPIAVWSNLLADYDRLELANEFMKVADRLVETGAGGEYFALLEKALSHLNDPQEDILLVELWFYLRILALSGRNPELKIDAKGALLQSNEIYSLDPSSGRLVRHKQGNLTGSHIKLWRLCVANDFDLVAKVGGVRGAAAESLDSLRQFVQHQI